MESNQEREKVERLMSKELDEVFKKEAMAGLRSSPFEAEALVKLVKNIIITVDNGTEDLEIRLQRGSDALRRHRLQRVCDEALSQGALFTVEDLSYRIFNVGYATVVRDVKLLREQGIEVPLRSNQRDIGRSISHKAMIVRLWLKGMEYSAIERRSKHSVVAINRYINLFKRIIALSERGFDEPSIAFLTKTSLQLVREYQKLYGKYKNEAFPGRLLELKRYLKKTTQLKTSEMVQQWL